MGVKVLRRGPVSVFDYRCEVRPGDKPFAEIHASMSVSYVRHGSFGYRARGKSYDLVGGSLLIGNAGDEFTCTHDYAHGDRCLSFHLAPELAEEIAPPAFWRSARVPPLEATTVIGELARAAGDGRASIALEEAGLLLAHQAARALTGTADDLRVSERNRRCAVETALWLDEQCDRDIALSDAAALCGLSPFHFLRVFTSVAGVTPHQYVVRARLRRAAHLLATCRRSVTQIALDCGFADLSNFSKAFRRASGRSPGAFRNFYQA